MGTKKSRGFFAPTQFITHLYSYSLASFYFAFFFPQTRTKASRNLHMADTAWSACSTGTGLWRQKISNKLSLLKKENVINTSRKRDTLNLVLFLRGDWPLCFCVSRAVHQWGSVKFLCGADYINSTFSASQMSTRTLRFLFSEAQERQKGVSRLIYLLQISGSAGRN